MSMNTESHNPCNMLNNLRPRQNGRHFADDIFKRIFLNENIWIPIKISLKFVPKGSINNIPALVQIMAWCRPGDKPLSEPMMVNLPTHKCVTRPHWVNRIFMGPLLLTETLIPAWINNHMPSKMWDEISYPFPNFNSYTVEVWEWISNFISHIIMNVITYPCWG